MVRPKWVILVGVAAFVFATMQTAPTFAKENGELLTEDHVTPNWWQRKLAEAPGVLPGVMSTFGEGYNEEVEDIDMRQLLGKRRKGGGRGRRRDDDGRRNDDGGRKGKRKLLGEVDVESVVDGTKLLGEVDIVSDNVNDVTGVTRSLLGGGRGNRRGKRRPRRRGRKRDRDDK